MFKLLPQDIRLGLKLKDKTQVIEEIAAALAKTGYVEQGYVSGMLNREQQASTYLGNGIAIPHGTTDTRGLVKQTGVQVFQFPEGVVWGDEGQLAYVVIGIAASSDEHLALLRQLTHVLSEEGIEKKLAQVSTAAELQAILQGKTTNTELIFDNRLISLNVSSDNLVTLQALNIGNLKKVAAIDNHFIAQSMNQAPVHLGHGIWLSDSQQGNLISAVAIARPLVPIQYQQQLINMLITVSVADDTVDAILTTLASRLLVHQVDELLHAEGAELIALLNPSEAQADGEISAEFTVINPHGLHTRPGSLLVKVVKEFNCLISVANLDGSGKAVNAGSLMKVVSLGAKKGHRLRFTAVGDDAAVALEAIGKAMADGLGEKE